MIAGAGAALTTLGLSGRAAAAALTPRQQAGQRVPFSYPGLTVPQSLLNEISAGRAARVIFFGNNISSLSQISSVVGQLRAAAQAGPVSAPLLLMTDQEGAPGAAVARRADAPWRTPAPARSARSPPPGPAWTSC